MQLVDNAVAADGNPVARQMTRWEKIVDRVKRQCLRLRRKLPYLVWYDDEMDVTVTLIEHKLDPEAGFGSLLTGSAYEATLAMQAMGVEFDTGCGGGGYDWEWDYSLKGPISVRFRGRAERPERRRSKPVPRLIVNNPAA